MAGVGALAAAVLVAAVVGGVFAASDDDDAAESFTGCLSPSGLLKLVAKGDAPLRPCRPNETEVQFGGTGPVAPVAAPSVATAWGRGNLTGDGTLVARIEDFEVVTDGGAVSVAADLFVDGGADGLIYVSLDGDGTCAPNGADGGQLVGSNTWYTFVIENAAFFGFGTASVVGAVPVEAGLHSVDLCVSGGLSDTNASGGVVATWIPQINSAGLDEPCWYYCPGPISPPIGQP